MVYLIWRGVPEYPLCVVEYDDSKLSEALLEAERLSNRGALEARVMQGTTVCKARWGPKDPGGIFNSGGHEVDKGVSDVEEKETYEDECS